MAAMTSKFESPVQGAYCPSQKPYKIAVPSGADAVDSYRSLFGSNRKNLDHHSARKETLALFPQWSPVNRNELLDAGFYYTGDGDVTRCFVCDLAVHDWEMDDKPMDVHRRRSPNCSFVNKKTASVEDKELNRTSRRVTLQADGADNDVCGGAQQKRRSNSNLGSNTSPGPDAEVYGLLQRSARGGRRKKKQTTSPEPKAFAVQQLEKQPDAETLRRDNEAMRKSLTCRQCKVEKVQTLFLPCAHLITCESCANKMDDCLTCNKKILGTVRIFLV